MMRLRFSWIAPALALASVPGVAFALNQPDGTPIPQGTGLQGLFDTRGENINALAAAANVPETFTPSCSLTFTVLQRNAGYQNAFGWYNVTGSAPPLSDLHEFIKCSDPINTVTPLPDIKNDPAYLGGDIGFYQGVVQNNCTAQTGPANYNSIFYSEKAWNPDGDQQNPYTHLLIYNSTVTPNAFYFGWEDLLTGGDNDFDDLTTFVTGISCTGSGAECQTGQPGVCGQGTTQCQNGTLQCVGLSGPSDETCDGFDNDCNGMTDDGDLCPAGEVCDDGNCVPSCGSGEFQCPSDKVCDEAKGLCVDAGCVGVDCEDGETCIDGDCVDPCDGAVCPAGQTCVAGVCLDPCDAITCDDNQVCDDGACVEKCDCAGCPQGQECQATGLCLFAACTDDHCADGTICQEDGSCTDACDGVICPLGYTCEGGDCVVDTSGEGGGGEGGSIFSGSGAGGSSGDGGSPDGGASSGGGGADGASDSGGEGEGCDCKASPGSSGQGAAWLVLLLAALGIRGRKRAVS